MDKAMLAKVAARSGQLGVTTGIQCRDNRQSEAAYNAGLMNKGSRMTSGKTDIEKGMASPTNRQNKKSTAGSGRYTPHGLRPH